MSSPAAHLLQSAARGDPVTVEDLVPFVYEELRAMAHRQLGGGGQVTLQTTALVHEAYMKLAGDTQVTRRGKSYFYAAAGRAMRQVIVDRARSRVAAKRGGGARPVTLDEELSADAYAGELLELDDALERLERRSPRQARVVECRFFVGLSFNETAQALGVSERTVKYDWAMARAWLYDVLNPSGPAP